MIGYRKMKSKGLWKLSRNGADVVYTRKAYSKQTGEEIESKSRIITSKAIQLQSDSLSARINALGEDQKDLLEAIKDIKEQEAIIDPDA